MSVRFDLTCWYLNARRILEITGVDPVVPLSVANAQMAKIVHFRQLKIAIIAWMEANNPLPIEVLLVQENVAPGVIFTHHSNFFFSGLSTLWKERQKGKPVKLATAYSKLDDWRSGGKLEFDFHDEHLTSDSSWSELSGQVRKLVLGVVKNVEGNTIHCIPYVIANLVDPSSPLPGNSGNWQSHLEVHISQIDTFAQVQDYQQRLTKASLAPLKNYLKRTSRMLSPKLSMNQWSRRTGAAKRPTSFRAG